MLESNQKYSDPTKVLESIVDDNGQKIPIYEQKDIGEFFLNFLDRLQDGLGENKQLIRKMMGEELIKELSNKDQQQQVHPNQHNGPNAPGKPLALMQQSKSQGDSDPFINMEGDNQQTTAFDMIESSNGKLQQEDTKSSLLMPVLDKKDSKGYGDVCQDQ